jgi:hypothetical protein
LDSLHFRKHMFLNNFRDMFRCSLFAPFVVIFCTIVGVILAWFWHQNWSFFDTDFLTISWCVFRRLLVPIMIHLGSLWRTFGAPKFIERLFCATMLFGSPKVGFGASPGVEWSHFGCVFSCFCHSFLLLSNIFWSIVVGGGGGGSTVSEITLLSTRTFSASQPLTGTVRTCFATWIYPHVVVTTERVCVPVWVACLHLPFFTFPLHFTFCIPLCTHPSFDFLSVCTFFAPHSEGCLLKWLGLAKLRTMSGSGGDVLCSLFSSFFASIFGVIFDGFGYHFWITFWISFHILALFFRTCLLYRFFIEFQIDFGLMFDVFLIPLTFAHATF